jgi:hypothetical protein
LRYQASPSQDLLEELGQHTKEPNIWDRLRWNRLIFCIRFTEVFWRKDGTSALRFRALSIVGVFACLFSTIMPITMQQSAHALNCSTPTESTYVDGSDTYTVKTFTDVAANCDWTVPSGVTSIESVIVGGGGGAGFGNCGGGGGGGRLLVSNAPINVVAGTALSLTVGAGGLGGWLGIYPNWSPGTSGSASSITIAGTTYSASGGGGGGGMTTAGLSGGSGGGGTSCPTSAGGAADASTISGFTTYGNAGSTGGPNTYEGGGGGGAGTAGSIRHGGNGRSVWGVTLAGGGGGWTNGVGGTGGGGNAGSGDNTLATAGNPGTDGLGGGGGGGNNGGSGRVMIRYLVSPTPPTNSGAPTISGTNRVGSTLTATAGTWSGSPSYSYQWQNSTTSGGTYTNIAYATGSTYIPKGESLGKFVRVSVTATDAVGSTTVSSSPTSEILTTTSGAGLACHLGGTCVVGDVGPGTGVVFYVSTGGFACGPTLAATCNYLEAARDYWNNLVDDYASATGNYFYDRRNPKGLIGINAQGSAIGTGYRNTRAAIAFPLDDSSRAVHVADSYSVTAFGSTVDDWYLPAKDELLALYNNRPNSLLSFPPGSYWSSTETDASQVGEVNFANGGWNANSATFNYSGVRPIRAFASTVTVPAIPTLTSAIGGDRRITLAFTPGSDGGSPITDYQYSLNGDTFTAMSSTTSPFTLMSLLGRVVYTIRIRAQNLLGFSEPTTGLSATTTNAALDASEAAAAEAARVAAIAEAARLAAEAEAARLAAIAESARLAAEAEAARLAAIAESARLAAEAEAARLAAIAESARLAAEAQAAREAQAAAAEAKAKADEDARIKAEADAKAEAEKKAKLEAEAKLKAEADAKAKLKAAAEAKAKLEAENKAKEKAKEEAEAKAKADAKAKAEEAKVKAEEAKVKAEEVKAAQNDAPAPAPAEIVTATEAIAELKGSGDVASAPIETVEVKGRFIDSALSAGGNKAALKFSGLKVGTKIKITISRNVDK